MNAKRIWTQIRMFTIPSGIKRAMYLRHKHVFADMGDNVMIQSRKIPLYPELIRFGNNVRVASNVTFLTHDVIHNMLNNINGGVSSFFNIQIEQQPFKEKVGCIRIGDNVFIGANTTILYDVQIGNNVIIAAGSVVTKDIEDNSICAGVPAKKIGNFETYVKKRISEEKEKTQIEKEFKTEKLSGDVIDIEWNRFYERRTIKS